MQYTQSRYLHAHQVAHLLLVYQYAHVLRYVCVWAKKKRLKNFHLKNFHLKNFHQHLGLPRGAAGAMDTCFMPK